MVQSIRFVTTEPIGHSLKPSEKHNKMEVSQNYGYHFAGPQNKDYSILGSISGSPYFGKLPNL